MITTPGVLPLASPAGHRKRGAPRLSASAAAVALLLGLAACGGGSSSPDPAPTPGSPPAPNPGPSPSPSPGPSPAPTGTPLAAASCKAFPSGDSAPAGGSLADSASSPAGRSLRFELVSAPLSGDVVLDSNGVFSYARKANALGRGDVDSFVYKVTDDAGLSAQATATVIYGTRRIMPLGDSITDGVERADLVAPNQPLTPLRVGYRQALWKRLNLAGYSVDFVGGLNSGSAVTPPFDSQHEGHGGFAQADVATGVASWLSANPADVVLLHIGTNDVNAAGTASAAPTEDILRNVQSWTGGTGRPVELLLATIIDRNQSKFGVDTETHEFNKDLTARYNASWAASGPTLSVDLVEMNGKLNATSDMSDPAVDVVGLHPNATGYGKMADAWFDYLVQYKAINKCP